MATIIAKNVGGGEIEVGDLGIILGLGEQITLTDTFETTEIISSADLRAHVEVGDIVINDGSQDLSSTEGIQHLYFETEHEDQDTSSIATVPQRIIQVRRTTDFTLSATYQTLDFDTVDFQNDATVLGWNISDAPNVHILENGTYCINYSVKAQPESATIDVFARLLRNGTLIEGSESYSKIYTQEIQQVSRRVYLDCFAGDVITLQMRAEAACVAVADMLLTVVKEEGVKGTDGKDGRDGSVGGAVWLFGSGAPATEIGSGGYSYLDVDGGNVYDYKEVTPYTFEITRDDLSDGDSTLADAFRLVDANNVANEIIIDDSDPECELIGAWTHSSEPQPYGAGAFYTAEIGAKAVFTVSVNQTGIYNVYAWWDKDNKRDSNALYTLNHRNGQTPIRVVQNRDWGQFNLLGTFEFEVLTSYWELVGNIKGPKGDQGDRGLQGDIGLQGVQGPTGPQGIQGETGLTGDAGIPGPTGPQGIQGPEGPIGPHGESFQVDEYGDLDEAKIAEIETTSGASPEDAYLFVVTQDSRTDQSIPSGLSGDMYRHVLMYDGTDWNDFGPFTGIKGDKGDAGNTGAQGPQGSQGPQGDKGDTGDQGPMGPEGVQGPIGPIGEKGDTGDTGEIGPEGPEGPQGIQGPAGVQGPAGQDAVIAFAQLYDSNGGYNINSTTPVAILLAGMDFLDATYFAYPGTTALEFLVNAVYRVTYQVNWYGDNSRKIIRTRIRTNGTTYNDRSVSHNYSRGSGNRECSNGAVFLWQFNAGDFIEIVCDRQGDSGTVMPFQYQSWLLAELVRVL